MSLANTRIGRKMMDLHVSGEVGSNPTNREVNRTAQRASTNLAFPLLTFWDSGIKQLFRCSHIGDKITIPGQAALESLLSGVAFPFLLLICHDRFRYSSSCLQKPQYRDVATQGKKMTALHALGLLCLLSLLPATAAERNENENTVIEGLTTGLTLNSVAMAAGPLSSLFVSSKGQVKAVGDNYFGQLGDGSLEDREAPVDVLTSDITAIAASDSHHSLFVSRSGRVYASGFNSVGQLGDGTTVASSRPVPVLGVVGATAVAAGYDFSLFLLSNGRAKAVGYNAYGQLGDGTTRNRNLAVHVNGVDDTLAIAAGSGHSLFLSTEGTVRAVGRNHLGQLGDGTTKKSSTAVDVVGVTQCMALAAGEAHSIFLRADGRVMAVGDNENGQLGDGTTDMRTVAVFVINLEDVSAVSAAADYNLFLTLQHTVLGVGSNSYHQLGQSWPETSSTVLALEGIDDARALSAGRYHSLVLHADGRATSLGAGNRELRGVNDTTAEAQTTAAETTAAETTAETTAAETTAAATTVETTVETTVADTTAVATIVATTEATTSAASTAATTAATTPATTAATTAAPTTAATTAATTTAAPVVAAAVPFQTKIQGLTASTFDESKQALFKEGVALSTNDPTVTSSDVIIDDYFDVTIRSFGTWGLRATVLEVNSHIVTPSTTVANTVGTTLNTATETGDLETTLVNLGLVNTQVVSVVVKAAPVYNALSPGHTTTVQTAPERLQITFNEAVRLSPAYRNDVVPIFVTNLGAPARRQAATVQRVNAIAGATEGAIGHITLTVPQDTFAEARRYSIEIPSDLVQRSDWPLLAVVPKGGEWAFTVAATPTIQSSPASSEPEHKLGIILGAVFGGVGLIVGAAVVALLVWVRRRSKLSKGDVCVTNALERMLLTTGTTSRSGSISTLHHSDSTLSHGAISVNGMRTESNHQLHNSSTPSTAHADLRSPPIIVVSNENY
mmetsp:Transcript_25297/g.59679  ORF Transcript_25297/g.59679 Transcript_25297/m.59679 type:complete len:961 (+) Transcript_25297:85-2967(+)